MKPLQRLAVWARGLIQRETYPDHGQRYFRLGKTPAGVYVDHDVALTLGAFNACVRSVAETIGILDWHVFQRDRSGKRTRLAETPLDRAIALRPNPEMSAQTLREVLAGQALIRGNGFAEIVRDGAGRVTELWPLPPVSDIYRLDDGSLVYEFDINGFRAPLRVEDVFHVKGFGGTGVMGYDMVSYMAASIGYGIAVEEFAAEYFQNGATFSAVLQHPKTLSKEAQARLVAEMEENYSGRGKRHRFKVLEENMTIKELSATAEQAQLLESRKISVEDIARWFRVPLHKIGSLDRATFNNIEHLGIEFIQDTILPWVTRFEQEANIKLVPRGQQGTVFTKMKISTLARGDLKSRQEAYRIGREWGWLTPNDIREEEDMDPIPDEMGGDTLIVPLNFRDARVMVKETEDILSGKVNDEDTLQDDPEEEGAPRPRPEAMRNTIASACQRIVEREERYVGRKFSNGVDVTAAMRNQKAYAQGELYPIVRDMASLAGMDVQDASGVLDRVMRLYFTRHHELWTAAVHAGQKPAGLEAYASQLEEDLIKAMTARLAA